MSDAAQARAQAEPFLTGGFKPWRGTAVTNELGVVGQHLWLLCAVLWLLVPRLPFPGSHYFTANKQKSIKLYRAVGIFIGPASLALWFIQLTSGLTSNPDPSSWQTPQRWLALIPMLWVWIAILWWGFLRGGTQQIADTFSFKPVFARVFLLALIIFSIASITFAYQTPGVMFGTS